jgi:hypothetical protein
LWNPVLIFRMKVNVYLNSWTHNHVSNQLINVYFYHVSGLTYYIVCSAVHCTVRHPCRIWEWLYLNQIWTSLKYFATALFLAWIRQISLRRTWQFIFIFPFFRISILLEEFEDTKGVIRIRISKKNRQRNGQKKKYKRTKNDL